MILIFIGSFTHEPNIDAMEFTVPGTTQEQSRLL